ncbi:MAG: sigma-54-dependent Fis family transcriptional regulator [Myxococcales bacterium]|nr:sigma-54-dependent Fis family transcriptional regulator [Myxococcales bacterium]
MEPSVLVVDDDRLFCESLVDHFAGLGVRATYVTSVGDATSLALERYPVIVVDKHLPDGEGLTVADAATESTRVIMVTGDPSYDHAVAAMRRRVVDYFAKPIELEALTHAVTRALPCSLPVRVAQPAPAIGLRLREHELRFARSEVPILITGPTGTGKSRLAQRIHAASPRAHGPFVSVDCAALAESLVESELFGSTRGAYTGASDRPGLIALADGGTLFLDEVGELPTPLQAKLLSVLEEGRVRAIGSTRWRAVDLRIIAATHVDLDEAVAERRFRSDLLYRLDVGSIALPPLRQVPEQLEAAVASLLDELRAPASARLGDGELERLRGHPWPGNFRELRNALTRALVLHPSEHLRPSSCLRRPPPRVPVDASRLELGDLTLAELERRHALEVLRRHDGHRARTARTLGISEATLRRKLVAWDSDHPDRPDRSE